MSVRWGLPPSICSQFKKYHKAEYVQRRVCFVNVQSSLHENVVFSVCARMCSAAYVIFIMWNSISGLDACFHFRLNISCGVAVTVSFLLVPIEVNPLLWPNFLFTEFILCLISIMNHRKFELIYFATNT